MAKAAATRARRRSIKRGGPKERDREFIVIQAAAFWDLVRRAKNIAAQRQGLQRDENVAKLEGFVDYVFAGETPPRELLEHVAGAFRQYLESRGRRGLDSLLGAKIGEQGRARQIIAVAKLHRDAWLMVRLHQLIAEQGMSARKAAQYMSKDGAGLNWTTLKNLYQDWQGIVEIAVQERERDISGLQ